MSNTAIWAISLIALTIIIIGLFTSLVNQGKEVPTGEMIPKLRRKNGQAGEMEEYTIPNPNFDDRLNPDPHTNPRYVTAMEPITKTVYPNRGTGLMAILAVTAIVIGATFTLTHLNGEQGQTAQVAAEAKDTATNALNKATEASSKAFKAETTATSTAAQIEQMEMAMKTAFGRTEITVGEKQIEVPNFGNVLRKEDVTELLANIDSRLNKESNTRSNAIAAVNERLDTLTGSLNEVKATMSQLARQVSGIPTNQVGADTLAKLRETEVRITREIAAAKQTATDEIRTAIASAKADATTVPPSVIQPMNIVRSDINLSYRRAGVFGKRSATLSYQATLNGRPDKETNIVALLEKFEKDHNTMIVKGLEEAASKKQHANKDKAIVKLLDRVRADFNAWILGEWDFRRSGPAPQITDITITRWEVVNNDE